ncbi:hypothetical protein RhiirA5_429491 [Rhizophagus irregularis]|uniref:Cytochrome P450 n=1 Tax=Rhizophagus irregularis TaxID=588596 RepID=A0A2N0NYD3_9GLOM|nr:hypothetical protein RhiirA5_429491 [Rhizophagus irregularis]
MFGGGLRLCPVRKLSMIVLVCLTALMFRKYEINLVDKNSPIKITTAGDELLFEIKLRK